MWRYTIAVKIFGIAVGLLVLMGAAALLSLQMTRTVDAQLVVVDNNTSQLIPLWRRPTSAP